MNNYLTNLLINTIHYFNSVYIYIFLILYVFKYLMIAYFKNQYKTLQIFKSVNIKWTDYFKEIMSVRMIIFMKLFYYLNLVAKR